MQQELKSLFAEIVGLNNVIDDPALFGPYTDDFTDHYVSKPLAVVRPSTNKFQRSSNFALNTTFPLSPKAAIQV